MHPRLRPYEAFGEFAFSLDAQALQQRLGPPQAVSRNAVELQELDYGDVVFRFQDSGRLEEITRRAPVLHLGRVAVLFGALAGFVRGQDGGAFERADFLVSPRFGLAFVPQQPDWVTALARHCIPSWRALSG